MSDKTSSRRIEDAIKKGYISDEAMANQSKEMLNLKHGGQFGHFPALGTVENKGEYISNQSYVGMDLIPILIQAPLFFEHYAASDGGTTLEGILKAMVELHPLRIEGFNAGIVAEFAETDIGGAGEKQEDLTDMKRTRTEPVFTWVEKAGRPIQRFLDFWMRYGGMDPDTKSALVSTNPKYVAAGELKQEDVYTYDMWRMTMLFIEPDITQRHCVDAWLVASMFPKNNGDVTAKADKTSAKEIRELPIPFTGVAMSNDSVREYGNARLKELVGCVLAKVPDNAPVFVTDEYDPRVVDQKGFNGGNSATCDTTK